MCYKTRGCQVDEFLYIWSATGCTAFQGTHGSFLFLLGTQPDAPIVGTTSCITNGPREIHRHTYMQWYCVGRWSTRINVQIFRNAFLHYLRVHMARQGKKRKVTTIPARIPITCNGNAPDTCAWGDTFNFFRWHFRFFFFQLKYSDCKLKYFNFRSKYLGCDFQLKYSGWKFQYFNLRLKYSGWKTQYFNFRFDDYSIVS